MHKLKKRSQFQRAYKKGESFKKDNIRLYLLSNDLPHNRVGISITSKKTPSSVNRNRSKRLLLESYRLTEDLLKQGYDVVLIPYKDISGWSLDNVRDEMLKLYKSSGILR